MFLWSRAGQCHSEVPGKCTARCKSSLNSSIHFFVHLSRTRQPVPYHRVACRCLDGTCNEEPARQGGDCLILFWSLGNSSFPLNTCGDMAQPSLSLGEILAFLKSKKSKLPFVLSVEPGFLHICFSAMFFQVRKHWNAGNDMNLYSHLVNFPTKVEKSDWT